MQILKRTYYTAVAMALVMAIFDSLAWLIYKEPWMSKQALFLWALALSPVAIAAVYAVLLYIIYGPITD